MLTYENLSGVLLISKIAVFLVSIDFKMDAYHQSVQILILSARKI